MHAETLWQCDFFSKRILSKFGMPQVFAMLFLNVATRRVWISPCTTKPTAAWVEEQSQAFLDHAEDAELPVGVVSRNRDTLYRGNFDALLARHYVDVRKLAFRSPNLNAYVERFIQSVQMECLNYFLVFGEKHFDYLCREFADYYHAERPHQGLDNRLIVEPTPSDGSSLLQVGQVTCRQRLGGLLKSYHRAPA